MHDKDPKTKGWFKVSMPMKDDNGGEAKDAMTLFAFVLGKHHTEF